MRRLADQVVCVVTPEPLTAVGPWYEEFSPTTDVEVSRLLAIPADALGMGQRTSRKSEALDIVRVRAESSHYFHARLPQQFEFVLHFDETRAVEPLERTAMWETGEVGRDVPIGIVRQTAGPAMGARGR